MKSNIFSISGEKILLVGILFTPFTSLRLAFIGFGEILIIISLFFALITNNFRIRLDKRILVFYRFWSLFLGITFIGLFSNYFFARIPSGTLTTMVFDSFAYLFILITIMAIGHYSSVRSDFSITFFRKLFIYWSFIFVFLYFLSFFTPSIFGLPLKYFDYFSPLVDNTHQAAMITCSMCFVMLYMGVKAPNLSLKLLFFLTSMLFALMAFSAGSLKSILAVIAGFMICILHIIGYRTHGQKRLIINLISFLIALSLLFIFIFFYFDQISLLAVQFFSENDGSGARESLYQVGFTNALNSPIVGHGPGAHIPYANQFYDSHNSTLTVFLQGGIIGVIIFAWLNINIFSKLSVHFALFGAFAAIGIYILGGDILRRLPIWIILLGLYFFSLNNLLSVRKNSSK